MFMVQRKVFYKGPWCSQGTFHSSVCQYDCREDFVRWSALHDYSVIRITGVICRESQVPKIFFPKVSFKKLKCLMVCGIELSNDFSQEIGALKLDVFHMRNFRYHTDLAFLEFFDYCNSLNTLYVVHPNRERSIYHPWIEEACHILS